MAYAHDAYRAALATRELKHMATLAHRLWLEYSARRAAKASCPGVKASSEGHWLEESTERVRRGGLDRIVHNGQQ